MRSVTIHNLSPEDLAAVKAAVKEHPLTEDLALRDLLRVGLVALGYMALPVDDEVDDEVHG